MTVAAIALLVGLAARTQRCRGRQPAVDTATACTALATTARLASADAARLCVQFYKNTEPWLYILLFTKTLLHDPALSAICWYDATPIHAKCIDSHRGHRHGNIWGTRANKEISDR